MSIPAGVAVGATTFQGTPCPDNTIFRSGAIIVNCTIVTHAPSSVPSEIMTSPPTHAPSNVPSEVTSSPPTHAPSSMPSEISSNPPSVITGKSSTKTKKSNKFKKREKATKKDKAKKIME